MANNGYFPQKNVKEIAGAFQNFEFHVKSFREEMEQFGKKTSSAEDEKAMRQLLTEIGNRTEQLLGNDLLVFKNSFAQMTHDEISDALEKMGEPHNEIRELFNQMDNLLYGYIDKHGLKI